MKTTLQEGIETSQEPLIFLDVPLLYETHMDEMCDSVIVVYVDEMTQMKRLMARNHIDETQAQHLMSQQISIERKKTWEIISLIIVMVLKSYIKI